MIYGFKVSVAMHLTQFAKDKHPSRLTEGLQRGKIILCKLDLSFILEF